MRRRRSAYKDDADVGGDPGRNAEWLHEAKAGLWAEPHVPEEHQAVNAR